MAKNDTLIILEYIPPVERVEKAPSRTIGQIASVIIGRMKRKMIGFLFSFCDMRKDEIRILFSGTGVNAMFSVSGLCMADSHPLIAFSGLAWFGFSMARLYRKARATKQASD